MATLSVTLTSISGEGNSGLNSSPSYPDGAFYASEAVTPLDSPITGSIVVPGSGFFWVVTSTGGNAWVNFGVAPVPTINGCYLIPDGKTAIFSAYIGHTWATTAAS
jgi:hypothetical protein